MAPERVRIGIVGASPHRGWGKRAHLPALLGLPEYDLMAVCTQSRETAEESAKHYGVRMAFHDYHEMVNHPDIELVSVNVRVPRHYPIVKAALEAGKHVFCEWSLGANLEETEQLAALARSHNACHVIGLQGRFAPGAQRLKELLDEGYVGEVLSCNMTTFFPGIFEYGLDRAWYADRRNGVNTLTIAGAHAIDVLCFCLGEFREVSARVAVRVPVWRTGEPGGTVDVDSPDNVLFSGHLTSGAVASVHVSTVPWHGTGFRMEVYGREGTLVAGWSGPTFFGQMWLQGSRDREGVLGDIPIPDRLTWVPEGVPRGEAFNVGQLYNRLAGAIREGRSLQPDFDHAARRYRLLDAIQCSSDLGKAVTVP